jgi:hypothetical protein
VIASTSAARITCLPSHSGERGVEAAFWPFSGIAIVTAARKCPLSGPVGDAIPFRRTFLASNHPGATIPIFFVALPRRDDFQQIQIDTDLFDASLVIVSLGGDELGVVFSLTRS